MRILVSAVCMLIALSADAQVSFVQNRNQWNNDILFAADIPSGRVFFRSNSVSFVYYSLDDVERSHLLDVDSTMVISNDEVRCYSFRMDFMNASAPIVAGTARKEFYHNYFIGNNPSKWAGNVPVFGGVMYSEIYPGVNVHYYGNGNQLKYDFILSPQADASLIHMKYSGMRSIALSGNNLVLDLGFMQVKEVIPYSYQLRNGLKEEVLCRFVLHNNEVSFVFPNGYDHSLPLVIDPSVIAATGSGSAGVSAGLCATYDPQGNIYTGGNAFSPGCPVNTGAYDTSFNGGSDIVISKFTPDGSALLYCTYIGGSVADFPQSIIEFSGKLYIYGMTYSWDFPVAATAFSQSLNGITDIHVCCLDVTGSQLLGATYIGGTWGDGYNNVAPYYSDRLRGEIKVAANGDVLVISSCMSPNFPTTAGAYRTTNIGGQEAVVFRMDGTLSNLIWATYIGSSVHDAGLGILEAPDGSIYICGATNNGPNNPFPTVAGCYRTSPQGGTDGFIAKLNSSGSALLASSMFGANGADMAHFVDLDEDGDVYICGTSRQNTPVTPGVFSVPGGEVYVAKLDQGLTALAFCTEFGAGGSNSVVITQPSSPGPPPVGGPAPLRPNNNAVTAFAVDECKRMYIGAFCGPTPWPTTSDAAYQYTADNQFCVLALEENAGSLVYSTMHPGVHVDGGHGRFTKRGVLYQAVCVMDGENFPTMPWAYSDGSTAVGFDNSVFKVDAYVEINPEDVHVPNVFTPNGDGINDEYDPGLFKPRSYEIRIYNRWGQEVFHSTSIDDKWDGTTTSGTPCDEGVYFVALKYGYCDDPIFRNSFVHLFR